MRYLLVDLAVVTAAAAITLSWADWFLGMPVVF